jgi:tetratricopeptide (TPR) repeat protein
MRGPHSTQSSPRPWLGRCKAYVLGVCAALSAWGNASVQAADTHWLDVESRIQYAYYTEDAHALRNMVESLEGNGSHDALKSYYAGLLAYRQTQLAEVQSDHEKVPVRKNDRSKNEARQTVERCVSSLDHALDDRSDFPDALALQSACLALLAELSSWRTPFAAPKSANQLRKALLLAPKNPRVLLLDAIDEYERPLPAGESHSCEKFRATAAVFEAERANVDQVPGWGAAEAYTWLGRCYLVNGDAVPARDALERALLIAPEFGQARRLLSSITSG